MFKSFRVGSLFGIPLRFDITFLLVLPVFAGVIGLQMSELVEVLNVAIGAGIDPAAVTAGYNPWVLGFIAAVGLFVGVLLHELGHAVVAIRYGYGIEAITLWLFGGIAHLVDQPEDWRHEFAIAIAGPIVSVLVGVGSYAGLVIVGSIFGAADGALFVFAYLAVLNIALAAFNMLPGFPMDGGRVLRALLARNRPFAQATQQAAEVGKWFALVLGLFGLLAFNVFMIGIAFFIYIAAAGEAQQVVTKAALEGITVRDVMTPGEDVRTMSTDESVTDLLERMLDERHTGYPVVSNGALVGIVTLSDAQRVRPEERPAMRVEDVMTRDVHTIEPDEDAMEALTRLQGNGVGRLPVVENGAIAGIVSRTDIMTALSVIQQGGIANPDERIDDARPDVPEGSTD